jgi:hypothetical protein
MLSDNSELSSRNWSNSLAGLIFTGGLKLSRASSLQLWPDSQRAHARRVVSQGHGLDEREQCSAGEHQPNVSRLEKRVDRLEQESGTLRYRLDTNSKNSSTPRTTHQREFHKARQPEQVTSRSSSKQQRKQTGRASAS